MELYEQIRREYEHGAGTARGVARKFGVHRRKVRQALISAVPAERKVPERERPKLSLLAPFIDEILETDRKAPRKQRHTAHRIWMRLRREHPLLSISASTVRSYVHERKIAMGLAGHEVFVPQSYQFGGEAQVDWYEGWVEFHSGQEGPSPGAAKLDGERRKVYVFCMRSMASGAAFHRAYPHATQQAFLEAHELACAWFGGVFRVLRYDFVPGNKIVENARGNGAKILEGKHVALLESVCRFAWKRRDKTIIRVRKIHRQKVRLLLHSSDHNLRFAEVGLCLAGWMYQRHKHLAAAQLFAAHIVLDDGVAASKIMFFF